MTYTIVGSVFVTFDFVGFHRWPDAPTVVSYLRDRHRHLFKVRVTTDVSHTERAIEYHMLKRDIMRRLGIILHAEGNAFGELELQDTSCENMALRLAQFMMDAYPDHSYYRVEVSEDGENGSIIEARS